MGSLQIMQIGFMNSDSFFQLLDILCATLSERSLSLAVALLTFLGSSIYLIQMSKT